jgi:hypothetical protein
MTLCLSFVHTRNNRYVTNFSREHLNSAQNVLQSRFPQQHCNRTRKLIKLNLLYKCAENIAAFLQRLKNVVGPDFAHPCSKQHCRRQDGKPQFPATYVTTDNVMNVFQYHLKEIRRWSDDYQLCFHGLYNYAA